MHRSDRGAGVPLRPAELVFRPWGGDVQLTRRMVRPVGCHTSSRSRRIERAVGQPTLPGTASGGLLGPAWYDNWSSINPVPRYMPPIDVSGTSWMRPPAVAPRDISHARPPSPARLSGGPRQDRAAHQACRLSYRARQIPPPSFDTPERALTDPKCRASWSSSSVPRGPV